MFWHVRGAFCWRFAESSDGVPLSWQKIELGMHRLSHAKECADE